MTDVLTVMLIASIQQRAAATAVAQHHAVDDQERVIAQAMCPAYVLQSIPLVWESLGGEQGPALQMAG